MKSKEKNYSSLSNHISVGIIIFVLTCSIIIPIESKKNDGFSTELIHINSPLSPFFNSNLTSQGLLNHTEQIGSSSLIFNSNLYLMKISYGNPRVKYYHIVDTGSQLSWIQCLPCAHCYPSKYEPFNPEKSRTFHFAKGDHNQKIAYNLVYEDNSHSRGVLARETITVGSGFHKREFENFLFGCGHDNVGYFPYQAAGLVGFNLEERSFITQLRTKHQGKFSYCMAPSTSSHAGKISFGHEAIVSGNNVVTTPLILDSYYNIMLDALTVGEKKIVCFSDSYLSSNDSSHMNAPLKLLIDSGSNVMYLSNSFYSQVVTTVQKHIKAKSPIGAKGDFKLCYSTSLRDANIPKIKLHFPGGVLELNPVNTFITIDTHRCLAILATNDSSMLGNMGQVNFLVGYDLVEKKISFKPTNCARS